MINRKQFIMFLQLSIINLAITFIVVKSFIDNSISSYSWFFIALLIVLIFIVLNKGYEPKKRHATMADKRYLDYLKNKKQNRQNIKVI